jgi:hypothetical protein
MEDKMNSLKKISRLAGLLYLIIILAAVYGHMYVPSQIFIEGDAAASANNILTQEILFRSCIVAGLIETTGFLLLGLTLYRLLKDVNKYQARLMISLMAIQIPVALVFAIIKFVALMILKNEAAASGPGEPYSVSIMFLNIIRYGSTVMTIFSGLWLIPLGMLLFRSRFIPQTFGILLVVAGTGNVLHGLITVLFPFYGQTPVPAFIFFVLGEIPIMLWLLIKGIKDYVLIEVISERKAPSEKMEKIWEYSQ